MDGTLKSTIEGPRWARFDQWLKSYSHMKGLECSVERETTFLREYVRFCVSGPEQKLKLMKSEILTAIDDYNT